VSRPSVFTVFDLFQVFLPLISFELVSSAQFPMRPSVLHLLQLRSEKWFEYIYIYIYSLYNG